MLHELYVKYKRMKFHLLTDCDPFGVDILRVYKYGAKNTLAYNHKLSVPTVKWLGLFSNDIAAMDLKLSPWDPKGVLGIDSKLKNFLGMKFLSKFERRELKFYYKNRIKASLEALTREELIALVRDRIANKNYK